MSALLDPQSEWASLVISTFADAGVRDLVVSPGSRSTPFVLAATRDPRLRIHAIIDERSAAFFALAQGKASGIPSLLLCTSGSAPTHYLAAIIEARHARTPLLVLSADRPLEAQASSSPQAIDQVKLFGEHVARYVELGGVDAHEDALAGTRRLVAQAVGHARGHGAVHLNARARKPLDSRPAGEDAPTSALIAAARARPAPIASVALGEPATAALDLVAAWIRDEPHGIFVVGPRVGEPALDALLGLAAGAGYPILADATSGITAQGALVLTGALSLLGDRIELRPRLVVRIGAAPVAPAYAALAASARVVALSTHDAVDAHATLVCLGDPARAVSGLADRVANAALARGEDAPYPLAWRDACARAAAALRARITAEAGGELAAVVAVLGATGDAQLFVGNSLAVRELDLAAAVAGAPLRPVLHQRGANGIDGLVSGAAGAASVLGPTVLLLGDVSLLHDLHGLLVAARSKAPIAIVVLANGGGRIFDTLPLPAGEARALFTTPADHDLAALARFAGIAHARADHPFALGAAVREALRGPGATLIEAKVDPRSAASLAHALPALVAVALDARGAR